MPAAHRVAAYKGGDGRGQGGADNNSVKQVGTFAGWLKWAGTPASTQQNPNKC